MFYSQLLLAKKGPLAKVWMAAHWDKKLTKQAIVSADIRTSAEQLKKPQTPLSLRMSGHLLLGLSRIFARKVQYLYHDSSEAYANMKSVSRISNLMHKYLFRTSNVANCVHRAPERPSTSTTEEVEEGALTSTFQLQISSLTTTSQTRSCSSERVVSTLFRPLIAFTCACNRTPPQLRPAE
jgi:hypothetical protein